MNFSMIVEALRVWLIANGQSEDVRLVIETKDGKRHAVEGALQWELKTFEAFVMRGSGEKIMIVNGMEVSIR